MVSTCRLGSAFGDPVLLGLPIIYPDSPVTARTLTALPYTGIIGRSVGPKVILKNRNQSIKSVGGQDPSDGRESDGRVWV